MNLLIKILQRVTNVTAVLAVALLHTSCEEEADMFQLFITKKGEHYSTPRMAQSLQTSKLSFDAIFDCTAIYQFDDMEGYDSKNKLLGFSDCNSLHHENSARFVWQWFNNQLEIHAYCYVDGNRVEEFIGVVHIDQMNHYELSIQGEHYVFRLNNQNPVIIKRGTTCNRGLYYMLWPYFGGSLPAPHDISIRLRIGY